MHLIHSTLNTTATKTHQQNYLLDETSNNIETRIRFLAYQTTCNKYRSEIAAIQRYIPGWIPTPPTP